MTRRPSFEGAAARLKDYIWVSMPGLDSLVRCYTDVVTLFPCSSGTEPESDKCRPCASLEEEDGEDDTKAEAKTGADEHRGKAAVPLGGSSQLSVCLSVSMITSRTRVIGLMVAAKHQTSRQKYR